MEDINGFRPGTVDHLDPKFIQPLETFTYKSGAQIHKRKWIIGGACIAGAVTLIVGAGGAGKTTVGSQLCYSCVMESSFFVLSAPSGNSRTILLHSVLLDFFSTLDNKRALILLSDFTNLHNSSDVGRVPMNE